MSWVKLGLKDVLYDPKTRCIFVPNTGESGVMEEKPFPGEKPREERANPNHSVDNGRFTSGGNHGKIGKTKYAPSPRRSSGGIQVGPKKYAKLCGTLNTTHPGLKSGDVRQIRDASRRYTVKADGSGGMTVLHSRKIK